MKASDSFLLETYLFYLFYHGHVVSCVAGYASLMALLVPTRFNICRLYIASVAMV